MRGRGWEALGQSGHQKLDWPPGQSGENMGQRLFLRGGHGCLRLQEWGPYREPLGYTHVGISHGGQVTVRTRDYLAVFCEPV